MKKVILGKTYNTSTAWRICTRITVHRVKSTGYSNEWFETLYQRRKDDGCFIHKQVVQLDDKGVMYHSWEGIRPVSDSEADEFRKRPYKTVYE